MTIMMVAFKSFDKNFGGDGNGHALMARWTAAELEAVPDFVAKLKRVFEWIPMAEDLEARKFPERKWARSISHMSMITVRFP